MWELKVEHVEGFKGRFVLLTLLSLLLLMGFNGTCSILFYLSSFIKIKCSPSLRHRHSHTNVRTQTATSVQQKLAS